MLMTELVHYGLQSFALCLKELKGRMNISDGEIRVGSIHRSIETKIRVLLPYTNRVEVNL